MHWRYKFYIIDTLQSPDDDDDDDDLNKQKCEAYLNMLVCYQIVS